MFWIHLKFLDFLLEFISFTYETYLFMVYLLMLPVTLRCVIPVVCVTNEREESVVNQHNLFRKMLYSNSETTCFGL